MMKLVVALALAAAMPSAQAIGKSKSCDDPVHCFALDVFGDACQSAREEATTPNGADVALYPQWVPVSEAAGPSLEAGIGLPLGVQLDDPLACWDGCVAHLITELVDDTDVPFINEFLEGFEILAATLVANLDPEFDDCYCLTSNENLSGIAALEDLFGSDEPVEGLDITTVVSCDAGESAGHSGGRKLETFTGPSLAQGLGWLLKKQ